MSEIDRDGMTGFRADELLEVVAGQPARVVIHIDVAKVELRFRGSDDQPRGFPAIYVEPFRENFIYGIVGPDSEGCAALVARAGPCRIFVYPAWLANFEDQRAFLQQNGNDETALERQRILLGTFELAAGGLEPGDVPQVIELKLPASAGY